MSLPSRAKPPLDAHRCRAQKRRKFLCFRCAGHSLPFYAAICRAVERVGNKIRSIFAPCAFLHTTRLLRASTGVRRSLDRGNELRSTAAILCAWYFKSWHYSPFSLLQAVCRRPQFQLPVQSKPQIVRQIGRDLGVHYVLKGSVQRASDRIRISAQLIIAPTGIHRWAEYYDRQLEEVVAVQDDVVRTIVTILAAHGRAEVAEALRVEPGFPFQVGRRLTAFKYPRDDQPFFDGLRKAGLPE